MKRSDSLEKTIQVYESDINSYISGTPTDVGGGYQPFLDAFSSVLPMGTEVLEVGSANGRDTLYLESKGLRVTRTDVVNVFIDFLRKAGHTAEYFDVLDTDLHN